MICGANSILMSEHKHLNVDLSMNLDTLTVQIEVEQISVSKFNIKISNLLYNRLLSFQNDSFINFIIFKIRNK